MPSFKIIIPSNRTESGKEVTRWQVKKPKEEVTYDLLVKHLRSLIETPTSGYIVTWSDGENTGSVNTTKDLHEAIDYFAEKNYADRCVRLKAEPRDELDFYTALEFYANENAIEARENTSPRRSNGQRVKDYDTTTASEIGIISQESKTQNMSETATMIKQFKQTIIQKLIVQACESITIKPEPLYDMDSGLDASLLYANEDMDPPEPEKSKSIATTSLKNVPLNAPASISSTHVNNMHDHETNISGKASANSVESSPRAHRSPTDVIRKGKMTDEEVCDLARKLYMMGFRVDEKTLKRVVRQHHGNVNSIVDRLSAMNQN